MLKLFFIIIFFNIKFIEVFKFFSLSVKRFFLLKHFFFIVHQMVRSIIDRFNIIIEFLIKIENHDIIILSKSNSNNEFTEIDII